MSNCFNISPLEITDTFNTWFQRTNTIISTINDIEIAGISVYDDPSYNYFGQKIEQVNNSCYLTSKIITGPFINFIDGDSSTYGAGTSADPRKITLTFPNTSTFLADRQLTGNDELIINDGSVAGGIPVKRIKANDLVPSVIDVGYLRIQNRNQTSQGATFSFYSDSALNNVWSGISASSFSSERVGGFIPATGPISIGGVFKPIIPVTDETTGLIPDSFVRLPLSFKLNDVTIQGFESPADVKFFDLSAGPGITMSESTGTDPTSGLVNSVSYTIEALIPDDGNSGPYGTNLFNINGYNALSSSLSADSRSLLSANSGLSGGKGIKTNLINRDVSLPVTYIIPGDPNTVITYSGMTAVDIFTIEENPEDSNYVRKIGDIMTGTLTGTNTNFVFENGEVVNGFTSDNIYNTTLFSGKNLETENGYATFKIAAGSTFSVLDSANTSVLEITPTTDTISLNNGDHEFTTGNVSLSGVLQLDYISEQTGKTLFVNGESKLEGNVEIYEGLVVDGGITAVNGDVFIHGNVSITGSCLIEGDIETDGASFDNVTVYDTITGKFADFSQTGDNTGIKTYSSNIGENVLLANGSTGFVAIGLNENFVDNQNKKLTVSGGMSADYAFINSLIANDTETVGLTADLGNFNIIKTNRARREGNFYIYEQTDSANQNVLEEVLINDGITFTSFESGSEYITKKYLDAILPIGTIIPYAGAVTNSVGGGLAVTNPPRGWHLCDGSLKDVFINGQPTVWSKLYNVIGTTYGNVGARFRLPDLRGRVIRGGGIQGFSNPSMQTGQFEFSTAMGVYGGSERIALTTGQMPRHRHDFLQVSTGREGDDGSPAHGIAARNTNYTSNPNIFNSDNHVMNWEGNNEAHDNMQPYYNINYLIKYL